MTRTQTNNQLLPLVAAGNQDARDEMIEANLGLVVDVVNKFLKDFDGDLEYYRDDFISAGTVALVEAVNQLPPIDESVTAYLNNRIKNVLKNELGRLQIIRVPATSKARAEKSGKHLSAPKVHRFSTADKIADDGEPIDYSDVIPDDIRDKILDRKTGGDEPKKATFFIEFFERADSHTREELDACCADDFDREVLGFLCDGFWLSDIAERCPGKYETNYANVRRSVNRIVACAIERENLGLPQSLLAEAELLATEPRRGRIRHIPPVHRPAIVEHTVQTRDARYQFDAIRKRIRRLAAIEGSPAWAHGNRLHDPWLSYDVLAGPSVGEPCIAMNLVGSRQLATTIVTKIFERELAVPAQKRAS
jgi:hypothetical protein